jgi:2-dehydro-3-deoxygalactonokinase
LGDRFVAGDWGSTHLRLFLCRAEHVVEQCEGPGISELKANAETVLFGLIEPWQRRHGTMPIFLAGMVGSRNGWREVPYLPCPADAQSLGLAMMRFATRGHDIAIAPGLSCTNPQGAPDVMRGEETQILGALAQQPALTRGRHLMVLPGTHSKWVLVEDGRIVTFQTSVAGELYALLQQRSSLTSVAPAASRSDLPATPRDCFDLGLERCLELKHASLVHLLFEVRTRQLLEGMSHDDALAYLSGLIIGQDVRGALPLFDRIDDTSSLTVIGTPQLNAMYDAALQKHGMHAVSLNGEQMSLAGLKVLAREGTRFEGPHAA